MKIVYMSLITFCAIAFASITDCAESLVLAESLVSKMRNGDLEWGGDYGGLTIIRMTEEVRRIAKVANIPPIEQLLVRALHDPDRWIVAHAVLSEVTSKSGVQVTASTWNGLRVKLRDGHVSEIDRTQMPAIQKKWAEFFAARDTAK